MGAAGRPPTWEHVLPVSHSSHVEPRAALGFALFLSSLCPREGNRLIHSVISGESIRHGPPFKVGFMARAQAVSCPPMTPVTLGQPSTITSTCRAFQSVLCGQSPLARGPRGSICPLTRPYPSPQSLQQPTWHFYLPTPIICLFFLSFLRAWRKWGGHSFDGDTAKDSFLLFHQLGLPLFSTSGSKLTSPKPSLQISC